MKKITLILTSLLFSLQLMGHGRVGIPGFLFTNKNHFGNTELYRGASNTTVLRQLFSELSKLEDDSKKIKKIKSFIQAIDTKNANGLTCLQIAEQTNSTAYSFMDKLKTKSLPELLKKTQETINTRCQAVSFETSNEKKMKLLQMLAESGELFQRKLFHLFAQQDYICAEVKIEQEEPVYIKFNLIELVLALNKAVENNRDKKDILITETIKSLRAKNREQLTPQELAKKNGKMNVFHYYKRIEKSAVSALLRFNKQIIESKRKRARSKSSQTSNKKKKPLDSADQRAIESLMRLSQMGSK